MRLSKLSKRLLPLFVARFMLCLVFWFAVEKLFMTEIGFNSASIGLMIALYSAVSLTFEIPSGILADRWSRKGVLVLAAVSLAISGLVGWFSYSIPIFLISACFYGIYDALASGTYDSIIYDTLLEEDGTADRFEKTYGRLEIVSSAGLILSAVAGGLIGQFSTLRDTFLFSVPLALVAIIFLLRFNEPQLHKQSDDVKIIKHVRTTFASVFRNPRLIWILVSLFTMSLILTLIMEMSQLWLIALAVPVAYFGIAGALAYSTFGIGGLIARFFVSKKRLIIAMATVLICSLLLVFTRNVWFNIFAQFLIALVTFGAIITLTRQVHNHLPSSVRAGAGSALNTAGRFVFIPLVLGFGALANNSSVFVASWIIVGLIIIGIASELQSKIKLPKLTKTANL